MNKMRSYLVSGGIGALLCCTLLLSGCGQKMSTATYTDDKNKVSISLSYPDDSKYSYSTDIKDLRTSAENAILISDDYKIAWDVVSVGYNGDFESVKQKAMERYEAQDVEYNGIKGICYYHSPYVRYTIVLPVNDNCYVEFHVYSTSENHDKMHTDEVFVREDVQNILRTVDIKQFQ